MLRRLFSRKLNADDIEIRRGSIRQVINESQLVTPGKDLNAKYKGRLKYIRNNKQLTNAEKEEAKKRITWNKDFANLVVLKGPTYRCEQCHQQSLTISTC